MTEPSDPLAVSSAEHAVLSPSSSERWTRCPASVRMSAKVQVDAPPEVVSPYALEGTAAHALGELMARLAFGKVTQRAFGTELKKWRLEHGITAEVESEMTDHCTAYVDLIRERMAENPNSQLLLEQKLPTGVPSSWGTSDAVIVSPTHVEIIDLKYGMGVQVEAEGNPQLRLYGIGALEAYGDLLGVAEFVRMTVFQPRLNHTLSETLPAEELRSWRDSIIPVAEEALGDNAHFDPSEEACRWCPASGRCPAQFEKVMSEDFGTDADLLSEADLADAMDKVPLIQMWCNAVQETALRLAYSEGKTIPRYKVVLSNGRRNIADGDGAMEALALIGYDYDQTSKRVLRGIGELEKLLGKKEFASLLADFITRTPGAPSLVPEKDSRAPITSLTEAQKEFSE